MKRILCLILITLTLLSGCSFGREQLKEPVTFYYLRQYDTQETYDSFFSEGAIGEELREASGHRDDLQYLLALYMQGPNDRQLLRPFPVGSKILTSSMEDGNLVIVMNTVSSRFSEIDVTVSCACIAKTCMELVDADTVTVESYSPDGNVLFSRTFTTDNLILEDTHTLPVESSEAAE